MLTLPFEISDHDDSSSATAHHSYYWPIFSLNLAVLQPECRDSTDEQIAVRCQRVLRAGHHGLVSLVVASALMCAGSHKPRGSTSCLDTRALAENPAFHLSL